MQTCARTIAIYGRVDRFYRSEGKRGQNYFSLESKPHSSEQQFLEPYAARLVGWRAGTGCVVQFILGPGK